MDLKLVDPELIPALEAIPEFDIWADLTVTRQVSLQRSQAVAATLAPISNVSTLDYQVQQDSDGSVPVRVYRPVGHKENLPALLWIHGGGYCFGSMEGDDYSVKRMVEDIGCVVISVDYRLAPEFPFPVPLNDCYAALLWVFDNAHMLKVDKSSIAIGGISAGGGLAAGLALSAMLRDNQLDHRRHIITVIAASQSIVEAAGFGWADILLAKAARRSRLLAIASFMHRRRNLLPSAR